MISRMSRPVRSSLLITGCRRGAAGRERPPTAAACCRSGRTSSRRRPWSPRPPPLKARPVGPPGSGPASKRGEYPNRPWSICGPRSLSSPCRRVCIKGVPRRTAHLSVLTAAAARGRGLARATASAAAAHAIAEGRLPQWRARPEASRRVALALGFRELGSQVSIRLATGSPREEGMALRNQDEPPGADSVLVVERTATAPGLLLRPWAEQDVPAMVAAYRDPVMRQWLRHLVTTPDEAREIIQARRADWAAGTGFSFAVLLAEPGVPGDLVGSVSIRGLDDAAVSGEVGYWITAPARGRGIAARAVDAVCEWAFGLPRQRPLERLELLHSRRQSRVVPGSGESRVRVFRRAAAAASRLPRRRAPAHSSGKPAVVAAADRSAQMPGEEPQRVVRLELRQISVLAGVGVQCLLG